MKNQIKLFSGSSNRDLAVKVSQQIGVPLAKADVRKYANGETRVQILESVRGRQVFVIQSTSPPVNDNIMELLIMIDALKRASALSITVVMPYFGYAKQDKKKSGREPISAKLVADLLQVAGIKRLVTIDLHSPQIQGFFDVPVDDMSAVMFISRYIRKKKLNNMVVVSPDVGGAKRARDMARYLNTNIAIIDKYRSDYTKASAAHVVGEVEGKNCIIIDDFIDTGGSMVEAVNALHRHKAKNVYVTCTHGLLTAPAVENLKKSPAKEVIITDTIALPKEKHFRNLHVISVSEMISAAITRIYKKGSISSLFR